jgi:hypothetical protein
MQVPVGTGQAEVWPKLWQLFDRNPAFLNIHASHPIIFLLAITVPIYSKQGSCLTIDLVLIRYTLFVHRFEET